MTDGFGRALDTLKDCVGSVVDELTYKIHVEPYAALVAEHHRREIEHVRKEEYHRGYVDGMSQRKTETWQLDHDRAEVLARLVNSNLESGSAMRSLGFVLGVDWNSDNTTRSLGKMKARLAYLLGGNADKVEVNPMPHEADEDLKRDNRMYRTMLNDAATEYKKLKHDRDLLMKTLKKVKHDARRLVEHIFGDES